MKGKSYLIKAPAKINTGLRVLNRRGDGYHNIETIFYPIPLHDELKINIGQSDTAENKIKVTAKPDISVKEKDNICYKAAELFLKEFRIKRRYRVIIEIKKRIPTGAGLGGGSSDAAAVLKVLAAYFKIKPGKLRRIALKLGSDVPFFLPGKPAYASSRGEKLKALPKFNIKYNILIVKPHVKVSTKWAYRALDNKKQMSIRPGRSKKLNGIKKFSLKDAELFVNDFEDVVFKKYPAIGKIKHRLYETGAVFSSMSGSGSAVYGFYDMGKSMPEKYFKRKGYKVFKMWPHPSLSPYKERGEVKYLKCDLHVK